MCSLQKIPRTFSTYFFCFLNCFGKLAIRHSTSGSALQSSLSCTTVSDIFPHWSGERASRFPTSEPAEILSFRSILVGICHPRRNAPLRFTLLWISSRFQTENLPRFDLAETHRRMHFRMSRHFIIRRIACTMAEINQKSNFPQVVPILYFDIWTSFLLLHNSGSALATCTEKVRQEYPRRKSTSQPHEVLNSDSLRVQARQLFIFWTITSGITSKDATRHKDTV